MAEDTVIDSRDQAGIRSIQMDSDRLLPSLKNASSVTRQEAQKDVNVDYKTGAKFIGKIHDYKKIGKGIFIWPSGAKYEGEYCDNLRQGKGETCESSNGALLDENMMCVHVHMYELHVQLHNTHTHLFL